MALESRSFITWSWCWLQMLQRCGHDETQLIFRLVITWTSSFEESSSSYERNKLWCSIQNSYRSPFGTQITICTGWILPNHSPHKSIFHSLHYAKNLVIYNFIMKSSLQSHESASTILRVRPCAYISSHQSNRLPWVCASVVDSTLR